MMVLARLLAPAEFGLVGMVTAITGLVGIIKEAGLADAAVQSATVDEERLSMLFWINVAVGCALATICAASAPLVAGFYHEPRIVWIMPLVGASFLFTGLGVQHRAILLRSMRIGLVSLIDLASLMISIAVSITMATSGFGYWSLVAGAVIIPAGNATGAWLFTAWIPRRPKPRSGTRSMIVYGTTITLNSAVVYVAYNLEKVMLGRFWGAGALGIYGRAYQLINLSNESLQSAVGAVAFPTLARVQGDPAQLRRYFLGMYATFVSMTLPITMMCALFADDLVAVFLGGQWHEAAGVFRRLAPAIMVYGLINPFSWLMFASGRVKRSLKIALVIAPVVIIAYAVGLAGGPNGVALTYSMALVVLALPVIYWSRRGTAISMGDVFRAVAFPGAAAAIAAGVAVFGWVWIGRLESPVIRLMAGCSMLSIAYLAVLLFAFGQLPTYVGQLRHVGFLSRWLPADAEAV